MEGVEQDLAFFAPLAVHYPCAAGEVGDRRLGDEFDAHEDADRGGARHVGERFGELVEEWARRDSG
jgi:hypothetical protein